MPVQINEVVVRAHIKEPNEKVGKNAGSGGWAGGGGAVGGGSGSKEEIIKECVEAVLELLNRKNER
jgi:hypothetical protein